METKLPAEKEFEIKKFILKLDEELDNKTYSEKVDFLKQVAIETFTYMINREHVVNQMLSTSWGLESKDG